MEMEATDGDYGIGLPYDLFTEILRLLPSRDLAGSRRVCRAWRAAADAAALLPARLHHFFPPLAFPGVFVCRRDAASSFFAAPPPSRSSRGGTNNVGGGGDDSEPAAFRYPLFHYGWATVTDHCNGLLLLGEGGDDDDLGDRCVCNPATARCARLPPLPRSIDHGDGIFLAFDPAVSRHHEVFLLPQSTAQLRHDKEIVARPPVDGIAQEEMWTEISSEQLHSFNLFEEEQQQSSEEEEEAQVEQLEEQRPKELQLVDPKQDEVLLCLINLFEQEQQQSWEDEEEGQVQQLEEQRPQEPQVEEEPKEDEALLSLINLFEEERQQSSEEQPEEQLQVEEPKEDEALLSLTNLFEEEVQVQQLEDQPQQPQPQVEEPKQDEVLSVMVFSSRTNQWESRDFLPGHCAPGLQLCEVVIASRSLHVYSEIWLSAEYWRGSLYVHCRHNILMILRSSRRTYDMIRLPWSEEEPYRGMTGLPTRSLLASYNYQGVRYVALDVHEGYTFQLQVWTLDEPAADEDDRQLGWTLTHKADLSPYAYQMDNNHSRSLPMKSSMVLWEPIKSSKTAVSLFEKLPDYYYDARGASSVATGMTVGAEEEKPRCEEDSEYSWNSDEDNFMDVDGSAADTRPEPVYSYGRRCHGIIGLHPYKDVILLHINGNAAAYHLGTSRMQYLGQELVKKRPTIYNNVNRAFPYRPCYVDSLPAGKMSRCYDYD